MSTSVANTSAIEHLLGIKNPLLESFQHLSIQEDIMTIEEESRAQACDAGEVHVAAPVQDASQAGMTQTYTREDRIADELAGFAMIGSAASSIAIIVTLVILL